jgi:hypothetical protein
MEENLPDTQPDGSPVPPPQVPPMALGAPGPVSPLPTYVRARVTGPGDRSLWRTETLRDLATAALDQLDMLGDRIANAVGLR